MAKSREKVQQLGFWDAEVSKPDHDTVMLWAYDNAEMIVRTVCPDRFDQPWLKDEVLHTYGWDNDRFVQLAREYTNANPRPNPRICQKTIEYVLKNFTGYQDRIERIVGYADLFIETELPAVVVSDDNTQVIQVWTKDLGRGQRAPRILVEAKSVMPTVGELMRQIQLYRTAFGGKIVVVSPDDQYANLLAEQGVTFIKFAP